MLKFLLPSSFLITLTTDNNLTNRFHVAVRLFSNRSQMTSKCGKNKKVAHEAIAESASVSLMFLPHFDVFWDLLLNRHTVTWNLFVLYNKKEEALFISKFFNISYITRKPAFAEPLPTLANTKKAI